jgi:putative FmdB family regulatory protein
VPLYEYKCRACGAVTDIRHGFEESVSTPCPSCGSNELGRVFNPAGIVFKGSGFYVTDSRKGGSDGGGDSGASSDSKSETAA